MNGAYVLCLLAAALAGLFLLTGRLKIQSMPLPAGPVGLLLGIVAAFACAKLFYVLLMLHRVWPRFGWEAFLRVEAAEFSFFGGAAGMLLGMILTAKCFRQDVRAFLDAFAPCGAFLAGGARLAERFLGLLGAGRYVENPALARFPFAVTNAWGEGFYAVFLLEALCAFAVGIVFSRTKKENRLPGLRLERTVFYLCLTQILCESLRSQGLRWGFVRAEQVLCAAVLFALILRHGIALTRLSAWKRLYPVGMAALFIAALVGIEFALDRSDLPRLFWYGVMALILAAFGALERHCARRRLTLCPES